jgi:hypothetical protein
LFRSRNAGSSCYNVTPLLENCCSTSLFTSGYKRLTEGECKALDEGRLLDEGRILDVGGFLMGGFG